MRERWCPLVGDMMWWRVSYLQFRLLVIYCELSMRLAKFKVQANKTSFSFVKIIFLHVIPKLNFYLTAPLIDTLAGGGASVLNIESYLIHLNFNES